MRVRFIGMRHRVPAQLRELMEMLEARTAGCRGLNLTIAIDYGGRDELTRAVRQLSREVAAGPAARRRRSTRRRVAAALDTRDLPDPDFIIRTSGELRISNFLLWQGVYAEYDFPATAWPDFTVAGLAEAVEAYQARQRRFGRVDACRPAAISSSYRQRIRLPLAAAIH